ncbi:MULTISPECIES: hypothetical protein [unclassified Thiocapsa]|uniref:hypothetical protein n=1 Tax=unclassified Thiocapsa TaxID=2641286 RepID=UPI0035AE9013
MSRHDHPDHVALAPAGATMGGPAGPELHAAIFPESPPMPREQRAELDEAIAQIAANEGSRDDTPPAARRPALESQIDTYLAKHQTAGTHHDVSLEPPRSRVVRPERGGFRK